MTHAQLEDLLGARMREVTRQLFQDHLTLRARDEVRCEEVMDAAGVGRSRIERGRRRMVATVFGKVTVVRIAYRGTGVADLHLADAVLNLPDGTHSHGLARLAAIESARGSFADACERINALTGSGIGHRQVQELAVSAAAGIDAFYDALVPIPCTDTTPLILFVDGKGVVTCRHLVKDRLDITGARWGLSGAEAVLKLRAVRANGDFDAYWAWHQQQELICNHQTRYRDQVIPTA